MLGASYLCIKCLQHHMLTLESRRVQTAWLKYAPQETRKGRANSAQNKDKKGIKMNTNRNQWNRKQKSNREKSVKQMNRKNSSLKKSNKINKF